MTVPLASLDVSNRTLKRAQYEAFDFTLTQGNQIQVRNTSHPDPENHEYQVTVTDGVPTACTCPADEYYDGACKHRTAVAIRRPLLDAVQAAQVATDGGIKVKPTSLPDHDDAPPAEAEDEGCDCAALVDDFPCWHCYRTGRRALPTQ